jgi:hypothetical protein
MLDKVRHQRLITIEVRLHIKEQVRHQRLISIEVHSPIQDKGEHPKQDGMEWYHNNGLQHQSHHRNLPDSEQRPLERGVFFILLNIGQILWRYHAEN